MCAFSVPVPGLGKTSTVFDPDLTSQYADTALHASASPPQTHRMTHTLIGEVEGKSAITSSFHHRIFVMLII